MKTQVEMIEKLRVELDARNSSTSTTRQTHRGGARETLRYFECLWTFVEPEGAELDALGCEHVTREDAIEDLTEALMDHATVVAAGELAFKTGKMGRLALDKVYLTSGAQNPIFGTTRIQVALGDVIPKTRAMRSFLFVEGDPLLDRLPRIFNVFEVGKVRCV